MINQSHPHTEPCASERYTNHDRVIGAIIAFREKAISETEFAVVCWPYVKKMTNVVAFKFALAGNPLCNDIASEMWLTFSTIVVERYDPKKGNLNAWVMICIKNLFLKEFGQYKKFVSDEEIDSVTDERARNNGGCDDLIVYTDTDEIDKKMSRERFRTALAKNSPLCYHEEQVNKKEQTDSMLDMLKVPGTPKEATSFGDLPSENEGRVTRFRGSSKLSPDQMELVEIRTRLGWTQLVMADNLGIGVSRLASYEYGKTTCVPKAILDLARDIGNAEYSSQTEMALRFGVPIEDLLDRWASMGKIDAHDNRKMSDLLNVSVPTITRWLNGVSKPRLHSLKSCEDGILRKIAKGLI